LYFQQPVQYPTTKQLDASQQGFMLRHQTPEQQGPVRYVFLSRGFPVQKRYVDQPAGVKQLTPVQYRADQTNPYNKANDKNGNGPGCLETGYDDDSRGVKQNRQEEDDLHFQQQKESAHPSHGGQYV